MADPNTVLRADIAGQTITETVVIEVDTTTTFGGSPGGIENIPFVVANADAVSMRAIFWIQTVQHGDGHGPYLQLQYSQRVILTFLGIDWPHVSVATLVKNSVQATAAPPGLSRPGAALGGRRPPPRGPGGGASGRRSGGSSAG